MNNLKAKLKKQNLTKTFASLVMLLCFLTIAGAGTVLADNTNTTGSFVTCQGSSCDMCELLHTIMRVVNFCIKVFIPLIAVALIAWGGFMMVIQLKEGGADAAENAKKIITAAIIGLVIVYGGWAIVDMFMQHMTGGTKVKWYDIPCSQSQTMNDEGGLTAFCSAPMTQW